ncbi:MAG: hypothetical protein IJ668_06900 [Selenomonadaceae bacterium]|nr:hypothetical protein [Selenomonadaceae bacterium]
MLTHVCQWLDGWKNVKASTVELDPNVSGSVAAKSGLFFCELCGQYVTFVKGDVYCSHFRHSSGEPDKSCEDRAQYFERNDWTWARKEPTIAHPLRICVGQNDFHFERDGKYLSTAEVIGKLDGALFSTTSGAQLPPDSDVRLGKQYYLLATDSPCLIQTDIEINDTGMHYRQWRLYELKAAALTLEAAKFFLRYRCRLTDKPIAIRVLHPSYMLDDRIVLHDAQKCFVYVEGNAPKFGVFPQTPRRVLLSAANGKLIEVDCNERQQLLAAGRMQPLRCIYLRREMPTFEFDMPKVEVTDVAGDRIVAGVDGVLHVLPRDRVLRLRAEFDGYVELERDGYVEDRIELRADEPIDVIGIGFGLTIKIFVGLDCVRVLRHERSENGSASDEETYRRLERGRGRLIAISHGWGSLVDRLKDYPLVAGWLRKAIRAGHARSGAWEEFRRFVLNKGLV